MKFQLPGGLSAEDDRGLERTCLAGGPDNMPWPSELHREPDLLTLIRSVDESGFLVAPWPVPGFGRLMGTSATLMERGVAYDLLTELARGKLTQLRGQAAEWQSSGLELPAALREQIHQASLLFGRAVCNGRSDETRDQLQAALALAYEASDTLVKTYVAQVFCIRHQNQQPLESTLSCRIGPSLLANPDLQPLVARTFNRMCLPTPWHLVEAEETRYDWSAVDRLLDWAEDEGQEVTLGPLVDFSSSQLPPWLWLWERDLPSMATFMCRYVEAAVRRYRGRVRRWQLTAASNWANVLSLHEEELLGLTYRLGEAARSVDSGLDLSIGIAQPWGEYMALAERTYSPFVFADNLVRSGLNLSGLNLELVMGVGGRGSYCRDLLEVSRLLDLYSILGVSLRVAIGYPATAENDPLADPELRVGNGVWKTGYNAEAQADWASSFAALALCKRSVQEVQWIHLGDADPHLFPGCGLVNPQGQVSAALEALAQLRREHL